MKKTIILENCKFDWSEKEIDQAVELFKKGTNPSKVAEIMNEKVIDIGLLFIHLVERGALKKGK